MKLGSIALGIVLGTLIAVPVAAAEQGKYGDALRRMLTEAAAGTCPTDLMGDRLLAACREQLPRMQPDLVAAGPVTSLALVEAAGQDADRVETYKVTFARGETHNWHIGKFQNGKFQGAYSND